jgi:hypothetical protein
MFSQRYHHSRWRKCEFEVHTVLHGYVEYIPLPSASFVLYAGSHRTRTEYTSTVYSVLRYCTHRPTALTPQIVSADIENALYADPRISEAVAIGLPHARLGEVVGAIVALRPGQRATEGELLEAVRPRWVLSVLSYVSVFRLFSSLSYRHLISSSRHPRSSVSRSPLAMNLYAK